MELDATKLDEWTAGCKTPGDVAALYSQLLQRVIDGGLEAQILTFA